MKHCSSVRMCLANGVWKSSGTIYMPTLLKAIVRLKKTVTWFTSFKKKLFLLQNTALQWIWLTKLFQFQKRPFLSEYYEFDSQNCCSFRKDCSIINSIKSIHNIIPVSREIKFYMGESTSVFIQKVIKLKLPPEISIFFSLSERNNE